MIYSIEARTELLEILTEAADTRIILAKQSTRL